MCGLAEFRDEGQGRPWGNHGAQRLYRILISESAYQIWTLRNERAIENDGWDGRQAARHKPKITTLSIVFPARLGDVSGVNHRDPIGAGALPAPNRWRHKVPGLEVSEFEGAVDLHKPFVQSDSVRHTLPPESSDGSDAACNRSRANGLLDRKGCPLFAIGCWTLDQSHVLGEHMSV
ncbi:hypothetical protein GGX14DRAFT_396969 [Mycena pura]|uniref:Uncharacterized protein n=1 Tax=Mycena pura TaxID=153505 RepID=A0AAD6VAB5_9AGAR|nr:hypothetical protein GGX14DRAFT_396969 [Mycena pura]